MSDLRFWKIRKGDEYLARRVKDSFDRIYARRHKNYQFDLSDEDTNFSEERRVYFIVGRNLDNLLGYASCYESGPSEDIGQASNLEGLDSEIFLEDYDGNHVNRQNLRNYDGFRKYRGGKVLCINIIETFVRREGIGTKLLDYIKESDYELIELEANGYGPVQFFEANGFVDAGIDADRNEMMVMVWNNPKI